MSFILLNGYLFQKPSLKILRMYKLKLMIDKIFN